MSDPYGFPTSDAAHVIATALEEDLGPLSLDVTTMATIPAAQRSRAVVVARAPGVVAGVPAIAQTLNAVAVRLGWEPVEVEPVAVDGQRVVRGDVLATLNGPTRTILVAERTLLNILSRTSGVATHTRRWADELVGTSCTVLDTRKTTPGLRALEKYAVRCGGGTNKR
ncbi:MAG: nicotinate-nucleotide diphosphorylase (carboxylating), partial [Phycicoccus sp.]|nr:nicotinate-nucleotide diphosphorylase (carboxylating) [Phycicoccus sp.]